MKTQTFETSKGTLYVVDLPEGATPSIFDFKNGRYVSYDGTVWGSDKLPPGDWKEIGLWVSVSEEKAKEVVDFHDLESGNLYYNYTGEMFLTNPLESLQSLLETEISLKNPKGEKPAECGCMGPCGLPCEWDNWQTAESQVWKNPFLMFKTK